MKLLKLATLIALMALPIAAKSGEYCPPAKCPPPCKTPHPCCNTGYIFGYGGVSFLDDLEGNQAGVNFNLDADTGYIVGGGVGVYSDLLCGSRFEIEGIYAENDLSSVSAAGLPTLNLADADLEIMAIMANFLKEIPIELASKCITAYAGAGVGYAHVNLNFGNALGDDEDGTFAYQFIAGADIPINDCLAGFVQYKLLGISDTDYSAAVTLDNFFIHSVNAGLRVSF